MSAPFLNAWMKDEVPLPAHPRLLILTERDGARAGALPSIRDAVQDHLIGLDVLGRIGGYPQAAQVIRNRLPTSKKVRSGDLGEILATEYVSQKAGFTVPLKRLRYKDDRNTAMRGDDVFALRELNGKLDVLKVEAKSRAAISKSTIDEAATTLMNDSGRPKPSTLAFVSMMLRRENRDTEAEVVERLQMQDIPENNLKHLIFTFSGNNPTNHLESCAKSPNPRIERSLVGLVVADHQELIEEVFEGLNA